MHDRTRVCALGVVLVLGLLSSRADAQILDRAAGAVRGERSSSSSSSTSSRDDDDDDRDQWRDRDDDRRPRRRRGSGGAGLGLGIGRDPARSACPYDERWYGPETTDDTSGGGTTGSLRLEAEVGYAIAGAARAALGARAQLAWLGLYVRYSGLLDPGGAEVRGALLGRAGIELWLVDEPGGQLRFGGGVRHWHDVNGSVGGADLALSFDVFPVAPFVLSGELGAGLVGEAFVLLARAELGAMLGSTQVFGGYHYEALVNGPVHADLGGPMLGVRAWL